MPAAGEMILWERRGWGPGTPPHGSSPLNTRTASTETRLKGSTPGREEETPFLETTGVKLKSTDQLRAGGLPALTATGFHADPALLQAVGLARDRSPGGSSPSPMARAGGSLGVALWTVVSASTEGPKQPWPGCSLLLVCSSPVMC